MIPPPNFLLFLLILVSNFDEFNLYFSSIVTLRIEILKALAKAVAYNKYQCTLLSLTDSDTQATHYWDLFNESRPQEQRETNLLLLMQATTE